MRKWLLVSAFCAAFVGMGAMGGFPPPGQWPGTATNDNACAGCVGEVLQSIVTAGSPTTITTSNTPINVTSVTATPGHWLCSGLVGFVNNAATTATQQQGGINTATAAIPALSTGFPSTNLQGSFGAGVSNNTFTLGPTIIKVTANTSVFLVANQVFAVNTAAAAGILTCTRAR